MSKISILFPVYNKEKFLCRAIDSIRAQIHSEWELLAVDDGSTDRSPQLLDDYAIKDTRIRVFHKKNGGVASALNHALSCVTGVYITRCDPDDYVDANWLSDMLDALLTHDVDMVRFRIMMEMENGRTVMPECTNSSIIMNSYQALDAFIDRRIINGTLVNCLVKSDLFKGLHFDEKMSVLEDDKLMVQLLLRIDRIVRIDNAQYHYCIYENSLSNGTATLSRIKSVIELWDYVVSISPDDYLKRKAQYQKANFLYGNLCLSVKSPAVSYSDITQYILPYISGFWYSILKNQTGFVAKTKLLSVRFTWPLMKAAYNLTHH